MNDHLEMFAFLDEIVRPASAAIGAATRSGVKVIGRVVTEQQDYNVRRLTAWAEASL